MVVLLILGGLAPALRAEEPAQEPDAEGWIVLVGPGHELDAFKTPHGAWRVVGDVALDSEDERHLVSEPGSGVIVNDPPGRTTNLVTKDEFVDLEASLEFNVPRRSNSGIKFMGLYEIQIYDSYGAETIDARGNGGVYPRAELLPRYRHIDEGYPPLTNASRPPGEWQTLEVVFRAPRFDDDGKKIAHAKFVKVVLNGQLIHEDLEVPTPTGHAHVRPEVPSGPILLQGDHGPGAFREVRVRPFDH